MDNMQNNTEQTFEYTYSAREQAEIESIRRKYLPREKTAMEELRELDRRVERPGNIVSIAMGVVGTLIFGTGMSCCMVWSMVVVGVFLGILGVVILGLAYPAYRKITDKQKEKLGPRILELSEKLAK